MTFSLPSGPASWLSGFFLLPPLPSLSHTPVGNSTWTWSVAAGIIVRQTGTYDLLGGRSGPERHFHVPVYGFKVTYSLPENYLSSYSLLVVPRHRLSSYGRRAFSVAGPAMWNWLSDSLRDPAISIDSFKRSLKTFLFSAHSCI